MELKNLKDITQTVFNTSASKNFSKFDDSIFTRALEILVARTDRYLVSIRTCMFNFGCISKEDFLILNANRKPV